MPHAIIIFGASGDLTQRKLIPALYRLESKGRLPQPTWIVGVSRTELTDESWRDRLAESTAKFAGEDFDRETWQRFAEKIYYQPGDLTSGEDMRQLATRLEQLESDEGCARVYYLSTSPRLYQRAIAELGASGLAHSEGCPRRLVIEKPFGTDLKSAQQLNAAAHQVFDESQIYRIDHYLGKETVQNMLVLRFANSIFEPIWNRNYIDHVQITVAEEVLVGQRADYYDTAGVLRDMFQNHLLQLLTITGMEAPVRFEADLVRDEKVKVLQALRPMSGADFAQNTIRGQYDGYLHEPGVAQDSHTATFAALKLYVDNWRWNGVPFYLRSGKGMSCRTTQIVIQFRCPPHMMFNHQHHGSLDANRLVVQVQPAEGIQLHFLTKVPDAGMQLRMTDLDFSFRRAFAGSMPDAYQRLLLDVMHGDASLFARSDEVELAWKVIDPILAAWDSPAAPELEVYPVGMWGPENSGKWMQSQGRSWFDVCPTLK